MTTSLILWSLFPLGTISPEIVRIEKDGTVCRGIGWSANELVSERLAVLVSPEVGPIKAHERIYPSLSDDTRIHSAFLDLARNEKGF